MAETPRIEQMTFVTTLRLQSGDRDALDGVVDKIRSAAERKGAEFKGPHSHPPERLRVPQYKRVDSDGRFDAWDYTVYRREIEIIGHDELASSIAEWDFPRSVHVEAEVRAINSTGS